MTRTTSRESFDRIVSRSIYVHRLHRTNRGAEFATIYSIRPSPLLPLRVLRENAILCRYCNMARKSARGFSSLRRKSVGRSIIDKIGVRPSVSIRKSI